MFLRFLPLFPLFFAAVLLWGGGQSIYEHSRFSPEELRSISYAELVEQRPRVGWLKVIGADWKLADTFSAKGRITRIGHLYVPVKPTGVNDEPVRLIIHIYDLEPANFLASFDGKILPTTALTLLAPRLIEGMLEFGIDSKEGETLKGLMGSELANEYMVIRQGAKPEGIGFSIGIAMILGGIGLLALSLHLFVKAQKVK